MHVENLALQKNSGQTDFDVAVIRYLVLIHPIMGLKRRWSAILQNLHRLTAAVSLEPSVCVCLCLLGVCRKRGKGIRGNRKKSDLAWKKMLPPDYIWAVLNAHGGALSYQSWRQLYDVLCSHVFIGNDRLQGYGCDPTDGRMYRTYGAETLKIRNSNDERYWQWVPGSEVPGSRFSRVAYLKDIVCLQLENTITLELIPGLYTLCWVLKLARTREDTDYLIRDLEEWETPVEFFFTYGDGKHTSQLQFPPGPEEKGVHWKQKNWFEYAAGEFTVEGKSQTSGGNGQPSSNSYNPYLESMREVELQFEMRQTSNWWKHNLLVDGIIIYSKPRW